MLLRDDHEHEVPLDWRAPFEQIVSAFVRGDFQLSNHTIDRVAPINSATAGAIARNVAAYGALLAPLNSSAWERSIYRWMDGYWLFVVDLTTEEEEISDLAIHANLPDAPDARLEIQSVHVP